MTITEETNAEKRRIIPLVMALANKIMKDLDFKNKINNAVNWDEDHWAISPGALAQILVLATFTDMRAPLAHIGERMEEIDLYGLTGEDGAWIAPEPFAIGRALERIGQIDYNGLYEGMVLEALIQHEVKIGNQHSDTTTISFAGEYDITNLKLTEEEKAELLVIEKGYNKDGRRGDNQAVVGQVTTETGIPLTSRALNGATSDIEWNRISLDYMEEIQKKGFETGIYVADSKLVIEEHVRRMNDPEHIVLFVSRCPASFCNRLEEYTITRAYIKNEWEDIGKIGAGKNASEYRCAPIEDEVFGTKMRLLVVESSTLVAGAWKSLDGEWAKVEALIAGIEKKEFACEADVLKEYARFKESKLWELFNCTLEVEAETLEKWPRGRRSANTQPKRVTIYHARITEVSYSLGDCRRYLQNESSFVIISNVGKETASDRELLVTYKGQQVVENSFRQLKGPNLASVIYLKNPDRIQALNFSRLKGLPKKKKLR